MAPTERPWPADAVERRPIEALVPYARNARTHSDAQVAQIAASIREWGWTNPILVDEAGSIIAGHGRVLAARKLGLAEAPVMVARGWTEAQKRAYLLADNKLALNAGWDDELLRIELEELRGLHFDLDLTGFSELELASLLADRTEGLCDPDDLPDPPPPTSELGDVWLLGRHRLVCGDSTKAEDVERALGGVKPHLLVSDPPYGVEYDADWRNRADGVGGFGDPAKSKAGVKTSRAVGKVQNDGCADWREAWSLFPGDVAYVWHASLHVHEVAESLLACGFELRAQIIWAKAHLQISRGHYHWQHEPCQPAGTMVSKVLKEGRWREHSLIEDVPIETLQIGDKVVSFGKAKVFRRGREITRIGSRLYTGNMHRVAAGGIATRATAEHQFTVRFDPSKAKACALYLMRRGDRWRVGVCGMFNSRGFGLAVRLDQERGEEAWIISAHPNMRSARVAEQVVSCLYGIPTTHWETDRSSASPWVQRDHEDIDSIYRQIGTGWIADGVNRLMLAYGLDARFPLIRDEEAGRFSRVQSRVVRACNLVPGIMQVPIPTSGEDFEWRSLDEVGFEPVQDVEVWSMDVAEDQHYVADGMVTHNCWYAVKKGATGHWSGDRKQTTLWQIAHRKSETGHSTQKPVECMRRPIENNSSPGQAIYEPFAGSGTTLIAAEQTGRSAHCVEIDPAYCDLICARYMAFTGNQVTLEETGQTFGETQERRGRKAA